MLSGPTDLPHPYTSSELISTLREYKLLKVNGQGYIPEYKRTKITDHLHKEFEFCTDTEIVPTGTMRKIIFETKKIESHTTPINKAKMPEPLSTSWFMAFFTFITVKDGNIARVG